nr:MAG TPA: hypothetical protein [Caudoviricetes sp.]
MKDGIYLITHFFECNFHLLRYLLLPICCFLFVTNYFYFNAWAFYFVPDYTVHVLCFVNVILNVNSPGECPPDISVGECLI